MEHVWHKHYEKNVPSEVDVLQYSSLNEILDQSFEKFKELDSFYCMGRCFTWGELDLLTRKFAAYLQHELNVKKGDPIAIMMPNILQYPIALFGILRAGGVVVNINPLYTRRELEYQLKDAECETIIIFENSCRTLEEALPSTKIKNILVTGIGDLLGFPKAQIVNFALKYIKKMIPKWNIPQAKDFKTELFNSSPDRYQPVEMNLEDMAFLQYTGGTTGGAKGAILTHGNIVANIIQAKAWVDKDLKEGEETIVTALPLYHIFSLTANCMVFVILGAKHILITNPRDLKGFVRELKKHKFTAFTGVNTLFNALLHTEGFDQVDFSSLKLTLGGGMAVQRAVAEHWKKVVGVPLIEAYGLTETSPAVCINPMGLEDYNQKIGLPISSTEVCILDDEGRKLPVGEIGEIAIKGPQVMKGYWKRPDETAHVMTDDGFFKSGDIGFMDENGFFQIVDRKKDMINVSGFNVFPNEVEGVLVSCEKILEAAVIGVHNEHSGEVVKAFIIKKDPSLTEEEVRAFCKKNLTGYKRPKFIEFRESLPKSNVGKILRKELRKEDSSLSSL